MRFLFRSANTDNTVFKLQYRCTVLILLLFSFVITCKLIFGYSFSCTSNDSSILRASSAYCYTRTPFIVVDSKSSHNTQRLAGVETSNPDAKHVYISYYPWVNLFFLVLAILLYLPHLFWKICEGGLMTRLTSKVNRSSINESEKRAAVIDIAKYIIATRGTHSMYTGSYVLSEFLNWLVGVLCTVWLVDFFKVDMFLKAEEMQLESWEDFFSYNFPIVSKCQYFQNGASGNIQHYDIICYLPLNKLYGYMFLFIFAWLIMMCVLSALVLPYRIPVLLLRPIRLSLFRVRAKMSDVTVLHFIDTHFWLGDWFLLTRLQKNLLPHDLMRMLIYVQQNFNKSTIDMEMDELAKLA